jgi:hypothetical protein
VRCLRECQRPVFMCPGREGGAMWHVQEWLALQGATPSCGRSRNCGPRLGGNEADLYAGVDRALEGNAEAVLPAGAW